MRLLTSLCAAAGLLAAACKDDVATGSLRVQISTTSAARILEDTDGFLLRLDLGTPERVGVIDSRLFENLSVGPHQLDLSDIRSTCTVNPPTPDTVVVLPDTIVHYVFFGSCQ